MPPRTVKKRAAGPGMKRATAARGTPKAKKQPEVAEESPKVDEVSVEVEEVKVEEVIEDKSKENRVSEPEAKRNSEILASLQHEDEVKDSLDEDLKGEQLDLEGNEPEYDPEEFVGGDYDDNEVEQENVQEEGDEVEEDAEGVSEEEDGDMEEDEMESVAEELECEVGEEHANMVAAEEKEHHEVVKERRKRKEYEIFVGGLDKDATEHDLRKVFSKVGEVTEVRLMMSSLTKKNKGFAFLRFATVQQAKRAYTELKNPVVNGKQCGVTPSQDSDTLFLGNICNTWRKETLKEKLKHYGVENYEDLTLVEDSNYKGMNRGFAFLEFSSRSDAMDASKRLQKRDVVFGVDRPAKVSFTDSYIDPGDEIMAQVKTVFVDGLPASWDEDRVRKLLRNFGKIEKIELARNMTSAKRKDFGFVTFDTHDAAVSCAKSINNEELGEGESKAKVRARLLRPRQRGKGKCFDRDSRAGHGSTRGDRGPWRRPVPRILPVQGTRRTGSRLPLPADRRLKRPVGFMERVERRPVMAMPTRRRPVARSSRSYERRPPPPVPVHPKSSLKRDYGRHDEFPPRGRASAEYASRLALGRDQSYRDDYSSRGSGYSDLPRTSSRTAARRSYADDGYDPRFEKPLSYREGGGRDYDLKRPYSALDDAPSRFADAGVRQSRARLDYELSGSSSQYVDEYNDRLGRSSLGYVSSRTSLPTQDSHGLYNGRQGSFSGGDVGGTYSSSYGRDYMSRGSDAGDIPYSSMYSDRDLGGSRYMGNGESRSYY